MPAAPQHITLEATRDSQRWTAACRLSGQPFTPFHSFDFLSLAARLTGTTFTALVVCSGGADVGVAPWVSHGRGPVATVGQLPFPYVGPVVPIALLPACLSALRRHALLTRTVAQSYQFAPGAAVDVDQALSKGWHVRTESTYVVDTSKPSAHLWAALDGETRRKIRKARVAGVGLTQSTGGDDLLNTVISAVFARSGAVSGYRQPLRLRASELNRNGLEARWTVATLGELPLGTLITLYFEGNCVGWLGSVLPEHRRTNANVLMYWDAIEWATGRGAATLDLVGLPDAGIDQFKRRFRGQKCEYRSVYRGLRYVGAARALAARVPRRTQSLGGD